jgi:hypothetical protein
MKQLITFSHWYVFQGRLHVMIWLGSFVTGVANDAFFMALPIVDNFWQVSLITPIYTRSQSSRCGNTFNSTRRTFSGNPSKY